MTLAVTLTWREVVVAGTVAIQRIAAAKASGVPNNHGGNNGADGDIYHIVGARGEMAVAKALNLYWPPGAGLGVVDVGGVVQVRTRTKPTDELVIRREDNGNQPYVLVIDQCPVLQVIGWIYADEGKRDEWWHETFRQGSPGVYFVPHVALRPIDELFGLVLSGRQKQDV